MVQEARADGGSVQTAAICLAALWGPASPEREAALILIALGLNDLQMVARRRAEG